MAITREARSDGSGINWSAVKPGQYVIIAGRKFRVSDVQVTRTSGGAIQNRAEWTSRKWGRRDSRKDVDMC